MVTDLAQQSLDERCSDSLIEKKALLTRGRSVQEFTLINCHKSGMKGVVWRAKDDLGEDVALKIVPETDYYDRSLIDEVTEASKLRGDFFAPIKFFGDLKIEGVEFSMQYKGIAIEWIDGEPLDQFVNNNLVSVDDFIMIAKNLFTALSILRRNNLCHDDLHPYNILMNVQADPLTQERLFSLNIIDTDTIKRIDTREYLMKKLREEIETISEVAPKSERLVMLKERLNWFSPGDHLRAVECLLISSNVLVSNYSQLDFWERKFIDRLLLSFFQPAIDEDISRRLDDPEKVIGTLDSLVRSCQLEDKDGKTKLFSPFDYISAEMITNEKEFSDLFSQECPWLPDCQNLEPIYIYGPRGCGKSSVLRWLSFKTILSDSYRRKLSGLREIGIYVSCSVELRSRFWLLNNDTIEKLQVPIIRFFCLILIEELFDTLLLMWNREQEGKNDFGLSSADFNTLADSVIQRLGQNSANIRFQGQNVFAYIKGVIRNLRWQTWTAIQENRPETGNPYPSLVQDVCKDVMESINFFKNRYIAFLIDDYSNQRIPNILQKKLNQTISFAKQGIPLFKVSSEYQGVDLEGIQEGREVIEVNVGEKYTSLKGDGHTFLTDILNIRLEKAGWQSNSEQLLGISDYPNISIAIGKETKKKPFYYHGLDCIHQLCTGDIALALDVIKKIFDRNNVGSTTVDKVSPKGQHNAIQNFSNEEVRRIKHIVPFGNEMHEIICYLGALSRAVVKKKRSQRRDKLGEPICMTHLDVRIPIIQKLSEKDIKSYAKYNLLKSRAIFLSLETSRSRISGTVERLQIRRIYFPAFKGPLKRDYPIKVDEMDDLISLLNNPKTFVERVLNKADVGLDQLTFAIEESKIKLEER